jgi:alpha-beta hydrolase superfamily lysophospholipase
MTLTKNSNISVDGVDLFYRSAGSLSNPVILLLHGFPSSSHQFRNLIPLLASNYYVIAPDLPGFGFTVIPETRQYKYTFANLAITVGAFVDALKISKFAIYILHSKDPKPSPPLFPKTGMPTRKVWAPSGIRSKHTGHQEALPTARSSGTAS